MKDWKQQIAEAIRARCDHGPGSVLTGPGCPGCQALFVDIMVIMNEALDELAFDLDCQTSGEASQLVGEFKRSLPNG